MTAHGDPTSVADHPRRSFPCIGYFVAMALLWATGCVTLQVDLPPQDATTASKRSSPAAIAEKEVLAVTSPPALPPPHAITERASTILLPSPTPFVWGLAGFRGFATGGQAAPNGVEFNPLFSLDLTINLWLWQDEGVYAYTETRFWGQKAAPGITNASQGVFDFSKREFDLDLGFAWNYAGPFEARAFVYSQSNLNRGTDLARPVGFKDGVGLENRWYIGGTYADLGQPGFDVARATFLSAGFYPTKEMVDAFGNGFKPGPFARAYLIYDLFDRDCYLYADVKAIANQSCVPKLLLCEEGIAFRPFVEHPRVEFRLGSEGRFDFQFHELNLTFYGAVRLLF